MRFFEGLRVIDLTHIWAGPIAVRMLADLGADVVRIERTDTLEGGRTLVPVENDTRGSYWERSPNYHERNASKRAMPLDLKAPAGKDIFLRLLDSADVLVENFSPGVMRSLQLDYETLHVRYPRLVMLSISGYGQDGPLSHLGMSGVKMEPAAGISSVTGHIGRPPMSNGNTWIDPYVALHACAAIIVALLHRERTGVGQYIDVSMQEVTLQLLGPHLMDYVKNGRGSRRNGARRPGQIRGTYPCAGVDEWVSISIRDDREWRAFCLAAGHAEWADDERFADRLSRYAEHDEIDGLIASWTYGRSKFDVMERLQSAHVPAGAHLKGHELQTNDHFIARRFFDSIDIEGFGPAPIHRAVTALVDGAGTGARSRAPKLGEHTDEVLREVGFTEEEIADFHSQRIVDPHLDKLPSEMAREAFRLPLDDYTELGILHDAPAGYEDYRAVCMHVLTRLQAVRKEYASL